MSGGPPIEPAAPGPSAPEPTAPGSDATAPAPLGRALCAWERYWLDAEAPARLRAFRGLAAAALFALFAARTGDVPLFYGPDGLVPAHALPEVAPLRAAYSALTYLPGAGAVWLTHGLLLASLLLLALGVGPCASAVVALAAHLTLFSRDPAPAYGVDHLATFVLLYLALAGAASASARSVALRLLQLHVCVMYVFAGLTKVASPAWWSGDAVWAIAASPHLVRAELSALAHAPTWLAAAGWALVVWELYFPVWMTLRPTRGVAVAFGLAFHGVSAVWLGLPYFAALSVATYVLFCPEDGVARRLAALAALAARVRGAPGPRASSRGRAA